MKRRLGLFLVLLIASGVIFSSRAIGQGRFGDVMVTAAKDKVIALPAGGSQIEEGLGLNETVVKIESRGQTGYAQTSTRLLGFSSELRRWTDVSLSVQERVERQQILPRAIVVQSDRQLYGFQEGRGHWTAESLGAGETVKRLQGRGHVVVALTSERALAFSSFTGGFFSTSWSTDERVLSVDESNDVFMIRTSSRTLIFRSQTTEWTEAN